ncbi:hypothetical protein ABHZ00_21655, partial [Bacteroides uniformis]
SYEIKNTEPILNPVFCIYTKYFIVPDKMAKHLQNNEGVWLSTSWLIFTLVVLAISYLAVILWAIYKR